MTVSGLSLAGRTLAITLEARAFSRHIALARAATIRLTSEPIQANAGHPVDGNLVLVTITDDAPVEDDATTYLVTVEWGDAPKKHSKPKTLRYALKTSGHTYEHAGLYRLMVTIENGITATAYTTASVQETVALSSPTAQI